MCVDLAVNLELKKQTVRQVYVLLLFLPRRGSPFYNHRQNRVAPQWSFLSTLSQNYICQHEQNWLQSDRVYQHLIEGPRITIQSMALLCDHLSNDDVLCWTSVSKTNSDLFSGQSVCSIIYCVTYLVGLLYFDFVYIVLLYSSDRFS